MKVTKRVLYNGSIEYRNEHRKLHREDGPAVILKNGDKEWYLNGLAHREDGPAVICSDGIVEYWLNDTHYEYKEWLDRVTNPIMYKWRKYCESH